MHPDLISIGPFTIHSYGLMIVIGYFAGLGIIRMRCDRYGFRWPVAMDLSFYLLLFGVLGAKLLFWIIFPSDFIADMQLIVSDPREFVTRFGGGFVFFGGLFAGAIVLYYYVRKYDLRLRHTIDLLTPAVPFAHAFGRIGCFLAGCCYGKECDLPWAVTFTNPKTLAPFGIPLHPAQLYESAFLFALTSLLLILESRITRVPGRMLPTYVLSYTIWRVFVELFRGDPRGTFLQTGLTTTQAVAMIAAGLSIVALIFLTRNEALLDARHTNRTPGNSD